jgi:hypothetical protein
MQLATKTSDCIERVDSRDLLMEFMKGLLVALDFISVFNEAQEDADEEATYDRNLPAYFASFTAWKTFVDDPKGGKCVGNKYLDDLVADVATKVEPHKDKMIELGHKLVKSKLAHIAALKVRLQKVAGGNDTGKSWKAGIPADAQLTSPELVAGMAIVKGLFSKAIDDRVQELREALLDRH